MTTVEKEYRRDLERYWSEYIAEAERKIDEWERKRVRRRFEFGCKIANALAEAEHGEDFAGKVADDIGKSKSTVYDHKNFAVTCMEEYSHAWDPAVAGYLAACDERDRKLTWRAALRWMRSQDDSEGSEDDTADVDPKLQKLENGMETVEEASEDLAEDYNEDRVPDDMVEEVEGALTRAFQILEEDEVPKVKDERRVEHDTYREWVASHACVACGVDGPTVVGHHLDRGGTASKGSDHLVTPLCSDDHQRVHDGNLTLGVEAWKRAAELQSKYLDAVVRASGE